MYVLLILASNACCVYILTLMLLVASYIRVYPGGHMYVFLLLAYNAYCVYIFTHLMLRLLLSKAQGHNDFLKPLILTLVLLVAR